MICFEGNKHVGPLHEILRVPTEMPDYDKVIRWCSNCGAIAIDGEYDGRIYPGQSVPMRFPNYR